jgi:hypothetical protein
MCRQLTLFVIFLVTVIFSGIIMQKYLKSWAQSNPQPPCTGDNYGTPQQARAIELAMFSGAAAQVEAAINAAKQTRGVRVGCAEATYSYSTPNFQEPTLAQITQVWEQVHAPQIANYQATCPAVGRDWAAIALGAYYARAANRQVEIRKLAEIGRVFDAVQYKEANAPAPLVTYAGMYGYLRTVQSDPCYRGGIIGPSVEQLCSQFPQYCVTYNNGRFSGRQFVTADIIPEQQIYDGGAAYDQGFAGVMMFHAAREFVGEKELARRPVGERLLFRGLKNRFRRSAVLAAEWAITEPPVRNHNYTAKLVWLLAEAYLHTGETRFKTAMLDKINRNLKLGVLMDLNGDGLVDGMSGAAFSQLTLTAQRPGRNWDAHNALPWYGAMNAWAMTEAYAALRDRGDAAEAAELKPYVIAMLDNLAWEINNLGVRPVQTGQYDLGQTQILNALLIGLWKVADYEQEPRQNWRQASAALWNTGLPNTFGGFTTWNTGLYLLYRSGVPYQPVLNQEPAKLDILDNKSPAHRAR